MIELERRVLLRHYLDQGLTKTAIAERLGQSLDILATPLIKALASHDLEGAEKLGALELAEEDLALCEYVCPSKIRVTTLLRDMLDRIEKEG